MKTLNDFYQAADLVDEALREGHITKEEEMLHYNALETEAVELNLLSTAPAAGESE